MIIDAHLHAVPPALPGVGLLDPILKASLEERAVALRRGMDEAEASAALAMGCLGGGDQDPLGVAETLRLAEMVPGLCAIGVADPRRIDTAWLNTVEKQLATGQVKALKAYLGYLYYGPDHANYAPYYELAERFNIPFFFHTGDTYSPSAKLRFAQPLLIDDVAVDFPKVRFIMAHFGNPWLTEAAEIVYKNVNVWADLSGLIIGGEKMLSADERQEALSEVRTAVSQAFRFAERPNRFIYGSDWPLAPMVPYRAFVASVIPPLHHEQVFAENARMLFRLSH